MAAYPLSHTLAILADRSRHTVGSTLQYSASGRGPWALVSAHDTLADAVAAFHAIPHFLDRDPAHYRISAAQDARPNAAHPLPADFRPGYAGEQTEVRR